MRVIIRISLRPTCLACGSKLGFFRRLLGTTFCCEEHRKESLSEIMALEVDSLEDSGVDADTGSTVV